MSDSQMTNEQAVTVLTDILRCTPNLPPDAEQPQGEQPAMYTAIRDDQGHAYAIADSNGYVIVHLDTGTVRNESEGGVERLLCALNRKQPAQQAGNTLEDNVRYLLDRTPAKFVIRYRPGGGQEELIGSLCLTWRKMQDAAEKTEQPAQGADSRARCHLRHCPRWQ